MSGGLYLPVGASRLLQEGTTISTVESRHQMEADENVDRIEHILIAENVPVVVVPAAVFRCVALLTS
jgi:hypothetical protein